MKTIIVTGTAGSGKSLLSSRLHEYYTKNGAFPAILNLDPGVRNTPYAPDVDVRDHIDLDSIMRQYGLGPNGALVMAADLVASKMDDISAQIQAVNPDYLLVDTPGQIELLAYRSSGPYILDCIQADQKMSIFLFDGALVTSPVNLVSVALLATSTRLRLHLAGVNALTKSDIVGTGIADILRWTSDIGALKNAISAGTDGETYTLVSNILNTMNLGGFAQGLIPISNVTGEGMINLEGALSRTINLGEELED